jgi:hypothetical protein
VKISVKLSLTSRISFLLLVAALSLASSWSLTSSATASSSIDNHGSTTTTGSGTSTATTNIMSNNTSLNVTTSTIELEEKPFEVGRHRVVSLINETEQQKLTFEGSTMITFPPGSAEPITTRDEGEGILTFLPGGGGILREEIHMNATQGGGSETATAVITEYFVEESPTSISLVYFSTNSTGVLAPLNKMIAVSIDEQQQNGDVLSRGFEWKQGNNG